MKREIGVCLLLCFLTAVIYGQTTNFEFINLDDDVYLTNNPYIWDGLTAENINRAFLTSSVGKLWQPLVWLSYMIDVELYGRNAGGFHATNAIIHAINAILLFFVLRAWTSSGGLSLCAAAVFAAHPLHVESVAWVTERKDVLSTMFGLIALLGYWRYASRGKKSGYAIAWFALLASLMSKQMLVTLPFVLLLLDYWPLNRWELTTARVRGLIVEKLPFFALTIVFCIVAITAQQSGGATMALDQLPLPYRIANAVTSYGIYCWKCFWPTNLAIFYPHPMKKIAVVEIAVAAGFLLIATSTAFWLRKKKPYLLIGWLWFLGTLVPVIGIVQVGEQRLADRFSYFPSIGVSIAVIWLVGEWLCQTPSKQRLAIPLATIVCGALTLLSFRQAAHWQDSVSVMQHAVNVTEDNDLAHVNLSSALLKRRDFEGTLQHAREAFSVASRPGIEAIALNNWGVALLQQGDPAASVEKFEAATRRDSENARAHNNWGNALQKLRRLDEAIEHYERAIEIDAAYPDAYNNLGNALRASGDLEAAIKKYHIALEFNPMSSQTHGNLAAALFQDGQRDLALQHFTKAVECDTTSETAYINLAMIHLEMGNLVEAETALMTATAINPNNPTSHALVERLKVMKEKLQ